MNCEKWLWSQLLLHGPVSYKAVRKRAYALGFKKSELRAAKKNLRVTTENTGKDWLWSLEE